MAATDRPRKGIGHAAYARCVDFLPHPLVRSGEPRACDRKAHPAPSCLARDLQRVGYSPARRWGAEKMTSGWTVRDSSGQLLADFIGGSRLDVGRKLVPQRYDAFRLHVSSSYRELFDRALGQILRSRGWEIVRIPARQRADLGAMTSTRAGAHC